MVTSRRRSRSLFRPMFDHLDPRITPSDAGIVLAPLPVLPLDLGDPTEIDILIPINGPNNVTPVSWPSDPLLILGPATPV